MTTLRQLTSDEAHVLDHLVDALMGKMNDASPWLVKAKEMGLKSDVIRRYALEKVERIENKIVEEYDDDDDGEVVWSRSRLRLPFDADYTIVAEDRAVLREYLNHALWSRDPFTVRDISVGTGDRMEMGMKMRRKKHE